MVSLIVRQNNKSAKFTLRSLLYKMFNLYFWKDMLREHRLERPV